MKELITSQQLQQLSVLLIGDSCIDIYQFGDVKRISPEAPVPIITPSHSVEKFGMASNVKTNLEKLGCKVTSILPEIKSVKTRLIDNASGQQILRMDQDALTEPPLKFLCHNYDVIIISDYDKGFVTDDLIQEVLDQSICPVFLDTKKTDVSKYSRAFIKINELEYNSLNVKTNNIILTRSSKSVIYNNIEYEVPTIPVSDVTGAGDTFISTLAAIYGITNNIGEAIEYAIKASSVTVRELGVYAPSLEEIYEA